jgi:endonuclease YncB( thermonuclease family)
VGQVRHGRTVGDVFLPDERLLNHELVRQGFAWWYRRHAVDNDTLKQLEADARKAKRGLWADPKAMPPWDWRTKKSAN